MHILKKIRKEKGLTLTELAERTGYTASFLSQLERGKKNPSLAALRTISNVLEVPIWSFVYGGDENEEQRALGSPYFVVDRTKRSKMDLGIPGTNYEMILPYKIAPTLMGGPNSTICTIQPGASSSGKLVSHNGRELSYIISGNLKVQFKDEEIFLNAGDSICISPDTYHDFYNCGDIPLVVIAFMF